MSVVQDRRCPQPLHGVRPCTSLTKAWLLKGGKRMSRVPHDLQGWGSRRSGVLRNLVWWTSGEKDLEVKLLRLIRLLGSGGYWEEEGWGPLDTFCPISNPCNVTTSMTKPFDFFIARCLQCKSSSRSTPGSPQPLPCQFQALPPLCEEILESSMPPHLFLS